MKQEKEIERRIANLTQQLNTMDARAGRLPRWEREKTANASKKETKSLDSGKTKEYTELAEELTVPLAQKPELGLTAYEDDFTGGNYYGMENSEWQLERAREKYNADTININEGHDVRLNNGKLDVNFYGDGNQNIQIPDSLSIKTIPEMLAVVETIMESDKYSEEDYGTKEHMVAQWIAHNVTYELATIENMPEIGMKLLRFASGASDPAESSKQLDIRHNNNLTGKSKYVYDFLESYILSSSFHGRDDNDKQNQAKRTLS